MNNNELIEKLYAMASKELKRFEDSLDTAEKAKAAAYELSVKRDILSYIEYDLSNDITKPDVMISVENLINSGAPLSVFYDEWLDNEYDNRMEAIRMTAEDIYSFQKNAVINELENGSYCFSVVSFDGNKNIAVDEYVGKDDPAIFELDEFKDYAAALDKSVSEVEVNASFYTIGEGGEESDPPSEEQLQYINEHLETILDKADLLESNTFSVDISEIEREKNFAEENKYIFTVVEFETGNIYVLPGVIDDDNIKDTSAWQEVKERSFDIDKVEDLDEGIRVTYNVYNADAPGAIIPSEEKIKEINDALEHYMEGSEYTESDGYVYAWEDCDDIITAMQRHWTDVHNSTPSISDNFEESNFLFPKEPKIVARIDGKEFYNLDESIEQIKLLGKEWLDVYDAAIEMNRRGVDIKDIEMLNVRCISDKGEYSSKDMTPEMYVVYHTRTDEHTDKFKTALQSFDAKNTVLYKKSASEARDAGEIDLYRKSNKVNQTCAHMIDAVSSNHYENNSFHAKDTLNDLMERGYSAERIALVVAVNIADKDWDRRLSNTNISWANEYLSDFHAEMMERRKGEYCVTMHPGLLNMFVDAVREEIAFRQETFIDKLNKVEAVADKIEGAFENGDIDLKIADVIDSDEIGKKEHFVGQGR